MIAAIAYALLIASVAGLRLFGWPYKSILLLISLAVMALAALALFSIWQGKWSGLIHLVPLAITLPFIMAGMTRPPVADVATRWEPAITFPEELARLSENSLDPSLAVFEAFQGAYQDIRTQVIDEDPSAAIVEIGQRMGWSLVERTPSHAQFEVTSRLLGFVDDVMVEWSATDEGYRVDLRSRSRVGISDLGANADRIRRFFTQLSSRTSA